MKWLISKVEKISQYRLIFNVMIFEVLLSVVCMILASTEIKLKNLTYSPELHQNLYNRDFSFTLPMQILFIYILQRHSKLMFKKEKNKTSLASLWSASIPFFGILCVVFFYISNSFY